MFNMKDTTLTNWVVMITAVILIGMLFFTIWELHKIGIDFSQAIDEIGVEIDKIQIIQKQNGITEL